MATPIDVFRLIELADERAKRTQNQNAVAAYQHARETLQQASDLAKSLEDPKARAGLQSQIAKRLEDLSRREGAP